MVKSMANPPYMQVVQWTGAQNDKGYLLTISCVNYDGPVKALEPWPTTFMTSHWAKYDRKCMKKFNVLIGYGIQSRQR
jgi:hypothetical protein